MRRLRHWVKLPNRWIERGELQGFRWATGEGSNNLAALMSLMVICHHADADTGITQMTYDELCRLTMISRSKLSSGLSILEDHALIERNILGRGSYRLSDYNPNAGWAKFPASGLYMNGLVTAFSDFKLRLRAELDAIKLYYLFASRRDRNSNMAIISYDKITEYSGVMRNNIKRALSLLAANGLIHVEHTKSTLSDDRVANAYRLAHLEPYRHMGTTGRGTDEGARF